MIANQLALNVPGLRQCVDRILKSDPVLRWFTRPTVVQLQTVIVKAFKNLSPLPQRSYLVIIDGLDECHDDTAQQILRVLCEMITVHKLPLRFLIGSRPESHIRASFDQEFLNTITYRVETFNPGGDIEVFLRDGFAKIESSSITSLVEQPWPSEDIIDLLVQRSSGQFNYAETVLEFVGDDLRSPTKQLEQVLKSDPTALSYFDQLHNRILSVYPSNENIVGFITAWKRQRLMEEKGLRIAEEKAEAERRAELEEAAREKERLRLKSLDLAKGNERRAKLEEAAREGERERLRKQLERLQRETEALERQRLEEDSEEEKALPLAKEKVEAERSRAKLKEPNTREKKRHRKEQGERLRWKASSKVQKNWKRSNLESSKRKVRHGRAMLKEDAREKERLWKQEETLRREAEALERQLERLEDLEDEEKLAKEKTEAESRANLEEPTAREKERLRKEDEERLREKASKAWENWQRSKEEEKGLRLAEEKAEAERRAELEEAARDSEKERLRQRLESLDLAKGNDSDSESERRAKLEEAAREEDRLRKEEAEKLSEKAKVLRYTISDSLLSLQIIIFLFFLFISIFILLRIHVQVPYMETFKLPTRYRLLKPAARTASLSFIPIAT